MFGDFSPSAMPRLLANLEDTMADSRVQQRHKLMPPTGIIDFVAGQETALYERVVPNDRKCEEFDVTWLEENDNEAVLQTGQTMIHRPVCEIEGTELQSAKQTYRIDKVIHDTVTIHDEDCGNMFSFESKVALAILQSQKKILARLAKALPSQMYAYAGANLANGIGFNGNIGVNDANNPFVGIAKGDLEARKVIPYLTMMATLNKFQSPKILDGGMLFLDFWAAQAENANGAANYWANEDYTQDIVNMIAGGFLNWAFVVDNGNLCLPFASFFPALGENNELTDGRYQYSIPMAGGTFGGKQIYLDVVYEKKEVPLGNSGRCEMVHTFRQEMKYNLWQAPNYTSDTVTGLIALKQTA